MPDLNEFIIYRADCTQNPQNKIYSHKAVVTSAAEADEVFRYDHVSAKFKGNHRSNDNYEEGDNINLDSDNKGVTDPAEWITGEDIHQMMPDVPMIISESKNNMKQKGDEPPAPRNHVFLKVDRITSAAECERLKKLVYKYYPFLSRSLRMSLIAALKATDVSWSKHRQESTSWTKSSTDSTKTTLRAKSAMSVLPR